VRALLLACSARKSQAPGLIPALERYDGPAYRMLRRRQREGRLGTDLQVWILSARYGLIEAGALIASYDQKMTCARALELSAHADFAEDGPFARALEALPAGAELFVNLGQLYLPAVAARLASPHLIVRYAAGGLGYRLQQMGHWLDQRS
jgi:hypothetical protein